MALLMLTASVLGGCAVVYEGKYDTRVGWHKATLKSIGSSAEFNEPVFRDCREELDAQTRASGRFALVTYTWSRSHRSRIVPIDSDSPLKVGDTVYVNLQDCKAPLQSQGGGTR